MRRYLSDRNVAELERLKFDVVIVGNGVAGLYAALQLDSSLSCAVLNKGGRDESNSMYAQGGIAAVIDENDTKDSHVQDTMEAGAGLCREEAVRVLVDEGPDDIYRLIDLGVPFDTDKNGKLKLTREGAHHCNRIVHIKGDATGLHATKHLLGTALKRENLNFFDNLMLLDVVTDANGETAGVTVMDGEKPRPVFRGAQCDPGHGRDRARLPQQHERPLRDRGTASQRRCAPGPRCGTWNSSSSIRPLWYIRTARDAFS